MTTTITLYYGDNDNHEFYEDEHANWLLIRNHGQPEWFNLIPNPPHLRFRSESAEGVIRELARACGVSFVVDPSRVWSLPYVGDDDDRRMILKERDALPA